MDWIKVEDSLPDEWVHVLTYSEKLDKYFVDFIVRFDGKSSLHEVNYVWAYRSEDSPDIVSHWTLLPERPSQ